MILDIVKPNLDTDLAEDLIHYFREDVESPEIYKEVPDFMIRDLFKSFNVSYDEIKYEAGTHQFWWYDMLQKFNNYLLKTVTQNKTAYSFIALKHAMKLLAKIMNNESQDDRDNMGNGNSPSKGGQQRIEQQIKDNMDQVMQDANKEIQEFQDANEMIGDGGSGAGKGPSDMALMKDKMDFMKNIVLNKKSVSKFIKKSIKGFKSGFGCRTIATEDELIDSDQVEDLLDEHLLFNDLLLPDIAVKDITTQMTAFDLYIDRSGSMSSSLYLKDEDGQQVSVERLKMAICLALKMDQMKCLGDVYIFDTRLEKLKNREDLWHVYSRGGTSIEMVMQHVTKTKRASVILTDGEDHFSTYTADAFIMSIVEPGSYTLDQDIVKKMVKSKKYIIYKDGELVIPKIKWKKHEQF